MNWREYFVTIVHTVKMKSNDPVSKVGALIVGPEHEVRSSGYNGFPRGIKDTEIRWQRPNKYEIVVHAELNAILNAARIGTPLHGTTLYVTAPPCSQCARAIIQAGIIAVRVPGILHPWRKREDMKDDLRLAESLLNEAQVDITYRDDLGGN